MSKLIALSLVLIFSFNSNSQSLTTFVAGHLRNPDFPAEQNQVLYTIVTKGNQLKVRIWENLYQGKFEKTYSMVNKLDYETFQPYVVDECFEKNHHYILAGEFFIHKKAYFEGIVVGIPNDGSASIYLCSILKNNGLRSHQPRLDLGPFELAYRKVKGLEIGKYHREFMENVILQR